jgi:hypothetical protein
MNAKKDNPEKPQIMANLTFISHLHIIVPKGSSLLIDEECNQQNNMHA